MPKPPTFIEKLIRDTSRMIIVMSVAGWILSSLAQISAIALNPKIKKEQKSFLIPQEICDAYINIISYLAITCSVKKLTYKLFSTGKFAPKSVRNWLMKHKDLYGDKIGKIGFNLDAIKEQKNFPQDSYDSFKNFYTTVATIGAGIVASNIVTPVVRNNLASRAQKNYLYNSENNNVPRPNVQQVQRYSANTPLSGNLKI